jgi:hypothetical protein
MPQSCRGLISATLVALALASCSNPTSPQLTIAPIEIYTVDVLVLESFPPQASARVTGIVGDGCARLHSVSQSRAGDRVTVTILRERPESAVCTQIARLYDETIRLEGAFPPGRYVLRVNDRETVFTTR